MNIRKLGRLARSPEMDSASPEDPAAALAYEKCGNHLKNKIPTNIQLVERERRRRARDFSPKRERRGFRGRPGPPPRGWCPRAAGAPRRCCRAGARARAPWPPAAPERDTQLAPHLDPNRPLLASAFRCKSSDNPGCQIPFSIMQMCSWILILGS